MQLELRILEALLFAATDPVPEENIKKHLPNNVDLPILLEKLRKQYKNRGVNLVRVAECWAFRTAPDLSEKLQIEISIKRKLSRASTEVLSIIAYHQPVTRTEIEEIRGVALSKGTIDILLEVGWIRPVGRRQTPGRPVTWGTSIEFLNHFNLDTVKDLPGIDELKATGLLDKRPVKTIFADIEDSEQIAFDD